MDDINQIEENQIQDGELVEEASSKKAQDGQARPLTSERSDDGQAIVLLNLESMIKGNIAQIDKLTEELKTQKEMLDSVFENDSTYVEHAKQAKEAARIKTATKNEILKRPDVAHISEKVKAAKLEVKELKESLSSYLQEYQRMSGVNEIEGEDGQVREIVYTAKLVKRNSKVNFS